MPSDDPTGGGRRSYLKSLAAVAGTAPLAGCFLFDRSDDDPTRALADARARELAERFAPTLYFDEHEQWFPTDPRPFETEHDGETVVDGFDAVNDYTDRFRMAGEPPAPALFYQAVRYVDSPLAVVQYWSYSVFDQFTTNFHWHDWEVLHVFVDLDTAEPQLYVASSHSGRVPNNEFLDPEPDQVPRILSELGSHSSALSLNERADRFQRLPSDGTFADITNSAVEGIEDLANVPAAYGLPRDEGFRLPFLVPELDDAPVYDHDRLPAVDREDLIADELTVSSFAGLASLPTDLPGRATGRVFQAANRTGAADHDYDLVPSAELEHIAAFTGPQLGFEFAIPAFGEDAISGHITTAGVPWDQPRYVEPAEDISGPRHRAALADRYDAIAEPAAINSIVATVTEAISADDAPEDEGLTTQELSVETVALLESEAEAVPTFGGTVAIQAVPTGAHRLTVNGAGVEPHSEVVAVAEDGTGLTVAGVGGEVPLVAREHSTKLEVDTGGAAADLTALAVEDDFAGRLYDAPLSAPDAVYLHRGGAFTTEVRDADGEVGAFRVNPTDEPRIRIEEPRTGLGSLAEYVADVAAETSATVETHAGDSPDDGSGDVVDQLAQALAAVAEAARRAADRAAAGDRAGADQRLATVQDRLDRIAARLGEADGELPNDVQQAIAHRLEQMRRRSGQARDSGKPDGR